MNEGLDALPSREPLLSDNKHVTQFYSSQENQYKVYKKKIKNVMIPALKRGEDDVGSYLQKHCKVPFSLKKNKVPTLNEYSHRFHLFFTTTLRPPKSFDRLSS